MRLPFADHHGLAEPALVAQPVLGLPGQLCDGMLRPELRPDGAQGVFLGHRLGAVLAELGRLALLVRFRPRAARAVEPAPLVQPQQRLGRPGYPGLGHGALQRHHHRLDAGSVLLRCVDFEFVLVDVRHGSRLTAELGDAFHWLTLASVSRSAPMVVLSPWPVRTTVAAGSVSSRSRMEARMVG